MLISGNKKFFLSQVFTINTLTVLFCTVEGWFVVFDGGLLSYLPSTSKEKSGMGSDPSCGSWMHCSHQVKASPSNWLFQNSFSVMDFTKSSGNSGALVTVGTPVGICLNIWIGKVWFGCPSTEKPFHSSSVLNLHVILTSWCSFWNLKNLILFNFKKNICNWLNFFVLPWFGMIAYPWQVTFKEFSEIPNPWHNIDIWCLWWIFVSWLYKFLYVL